MNSFSCVLSCREAIANFRKAGRGDTSSTSRPGPRSIHAKAPTMTAYTASKAAVAAFTVALAEEVKSEDISVIALCPSTHRHTRQPRRHAEGGSCLWVKPEAIAS